MLPFGLLSGLLSTAGRSFPIRLRVRLCNLRTRFLAKGQMGKSFRYVSRNGRILLAADMGISELVDSVVELRLQIWNRAILPGDKPDPFGFLLCVRSQAACSVLPLLSSKLVEAPSADGELSIDLGGRLWLEFCRASCQSAQTV